MNTTQQSVPCACEHCHCQVTPQQGFMKDERLYCCASCAEHKHDQPGACCITQQCC